MTLKDTANEDMLINFNNTVPGVPPLVYLGDQGIDAINIVPALSTKCKALGKKVGTTSIAIAWTPANPCPHTYAAHVFIAGGGSIVATAVKSKAAGAIVLRKDDAGTCAGSWQPPGGPPPPPIVCACTVKISNAGQTKAKAQ